MSGMFLVILRDIIEVWPWVNFIASQLVLSLSINMIRKVIYKVAAVQ